MFWVIQSFPGMVWYGMLLPLVVSALRLQTGNFQTEETQEAADSGGAQYECTLGHCTGR